MLQIIIILVVLYYVGRYFEKKEEQHREDVDNLQEEIRKLRQYPGMNDEQIARIEDAEYEAELHNRYGRKNHE